MAKKYAMLWASSGKTLEECLSGAPLIYERKFGTPPKVVILPRGYPNAPDEIYGMKVILMDGIAPVHMIICQDLTDYSPAVK